MINKIISSISNVSMTQGRYLSDKSYKYDTIFFVSRYLCDIANGTNEFEIDSATLVSLVDKIKEDFNLPEGSFDSNRNYILETLGYLQYSNVIEKGEQNRYFIINKLALDFITVSIENAYIFQYLVSYKTFENDGILDLYKEYLKPRNKDEREQRLQEIKSIMCQKSASIGDPNSVWASNVVKFSIMVLGLANNDYKVTRTLSIKEDHIEPKDLSANIEGTRTSSVKHNFYAANFRLDYVKSFLDQYLLSGNQNHNSSSVQNILDTIKEKYEMKDFDYVDVRPLYDSFKDLYGKETLKSLNGKPLLYRLFALKRMDNNSMIYRLEHDSTYKYFGGIGGGSAFKFSLYYSDDKHSWVKGTHNSNLKLISEEEAIIFAENFRNNLVAVIEKIESYQESDLLLNLNNYIEIETFAKEKLGNLAEYGWILKYFHLTFPSLFSCMTNLVWFKKIFDVLGLDVNCSIYERNHRFSKLAKELGVPNVYLYKISKEMLDYVDDEIADIEENNIADEIDYDNCERLCCGTNVILYGVPGAGKSWTIENEYCVGCGGKERLVFHPDYTYADFVGQILPKVDIETGEVTYKFVAGPFTKIVKEAYENPDKEFFLIIEEINRGNAPAIFGDVFQLLDRDSNGQSAYGITHADMARIIYGNENHEVRVPSNMSILATMNTSDQNVFTLDTAFQRRWHMRLIENVFKKDESEDVKKFAETKIMDTTVTWETFCTKLNEIILNRNVGMTSAEDKRLGTHFITAGDLVYIPNPSTMKDHIQNSRFAEKVIKYLWDDAFKFSRDEIFNSANNSLEKVIKSFMQAQANERFNIFVENIKNDLLVILENSKKDSE